MAKLYDLAVKTGEFTGSDGQTKGKWLNVGAVMSGNDGGQYMILDRTFNPAGLPNPENRSNVLVSMFEPKDNAGGGQSQQRQASPAVTNHQAMAPASQPDFDDDIPF